MFHHITFEEKRDPFLLLFPDLGQHFLSLNIFFQVVFKGRVQDASTEEKWRCYLQVGDLHNLNGEPKSCAQPDFKYEEVSLLYNVARLREISKLLCDQQYSI